MVEVEGILAGQVAEIWPVVAPLLGPAVEVSGGRMNMDLLKAGLEARDTQLWVARIGDETVGAWVTTLTTYAASAKICEIMFCGGHAIEKWMPKGLNVTEAWAAEQGYRVIEVVGRSGWDRMLKPFGYAKRYVVLEKEV